MLPSAVFMNSHHFTEVLQQLSSVKEPSSAATIWTRIPSITVTCAEDDTKNEKTATEAGDAYNATGTTVGNVKTIEQKVREESFSVYGRNGEEAYRFNEGNEEMHCDQDETCYRTAKIEPGRRCSKGFTAVTATDVRTVSASRIENNSEDTKRQNLNTAQHGTDKTECRKTSSQISRSLKTFSKITEPACSVVSELNANGGDLTRYTESLGKKTNSNGKKILNSKAKASISCLSTQKQPTQKPTSGAFCFTSEKNVSEDMNINSNSKFIDLSFKVFSNVSFPKLTGKGKGSQTIKQVAKQGNNLAKLNSEAPHLSFCEARITSNGSAVSGTTDFQTFANEYRCNKESSLRHYESWEGISNNDQKSNRSGFQVGNSNQTLSPFDSKEKELHGTGNNFRSRHLHKTRFSSTRKENELPTTLCVGHSRSLIDLRKLDADDEIAKTKKALTGFLTLPQELKLSNSKQSPTSGIHGPVNPLSSQLSRKIYLAAASTQWRPLAPRSKSLSELQEATSAILDQAERELDGLDLPECLPHVTVEQVLKTWHTDHRHWNMISSIISPDGDQNDAKRTDLEQVKQCRYIRDGVIHKARNARLKRYPHNDLQK